MDSQDFYNGMKTLSDWFGKKINDIQADIIYKSVKFIPDKSWNDIIERYTKRFKPQPSNFPTPEDIVKQWYIWQKENPEATIKSFKMTDCKDCHGRGLIWCRYFYKPLQMVYEESVRCSACENWKQHFNRQTKVPIISLEKLEKDPLVLEVWPYEKT